MFYPEDLQFPMSYNLDLNGDLQFEDPTAEQIRQAVVDLQQGASDGFLILSDTADDASYLQVAGNNTDGFALEYQQHDLSNHYYSLDEVTADQICAALIDYRSGGSQWLTSFRWEKMELG